MAFLEREIKVDLNYDRDTVFEAVKVALLKLNFSIRSENEAAKVIQADVRMTFTGGSWGDILTVSVGQGNGSGSQITVKSAAKAPTLLAGNKQSKNIEMFLSCLEEVLKEFDEVPSCNTSADTTDAVSEIKRYKELLDMGAITEEEYNQKKSQLLNL